MRGELFIVGTLVVAERILAHRREREEEATPTVELLREVALPIKGGCEQEPAATARN